jgi:hypothetical protein
MYMAQSPTYANPFLQPDDALPNVMGPRSVAGLELQFPGGRSGATFLIRHRTAATMSWSRFSRARVAMQGNLSSRTLLRVEYFGNKQLLFL